MKHSKHVKHMKFGKSPKHLKSSKYRKHAKSSKYPKHAKSPKLVRLRSCVSSRVVDHINRWHIFKMFRSQLDLVFTCASAAIVALNIETFLRHGRAGRYPPFSVQKRAIVRDAILNHQQMSKRYPTPLREDLREEEDEEENDEVAPAPRHVGRPTRAEALAAAGHAMVAAGVARPIDAMFREIARQRRAAAPLVGAGEAEPVNTQPVDVELAEEARRIVAEAQTFQPWIAHEVDGGQRRARDDDDDDDEDMNLLLGIP